MLTESRLFGKVKKRSNVLFSFLKNFESCIYIRGGGSIYYMCKFDGLSSNLTSPTQWVVNHLFFFHDFLVAITFVTKNFANCDRQAPLLDCTGQLC